MSVRNKLLIKFVEESSVLKLRYADVELEDLSISFSFFFVKNFFFTLYHRTPFHVIKSIILWKRAKRRESVCVYTLLKHKTVSFFCKYFVNINRLLSKKKEPNEVCK